jgi:hypothetical protein
MQRTGYSDYMTTQLPRNQKYSTVSGGDYSPDALISPTTDPEQRERLIPILQPQQAKSTWLERSSNFLERRRKTLLCVLGIVIVGTYGPAIKDVFNIASEVIRIDQELNSHSHLPFWYRLQSRAIEQKRLAYSSTVSRRNITKLTSRERPEAVKR